MNKNVFSLIVFIPLPPPVFYDLSSKLEFNVQYRVYDLEHTPLSMDYW